MKCENCKRSYDACMLLDPICPECGCTCGTSHKDKGLCHACARRVARRLHRFQICFLIVGLLIAVLFMGRCIQVYQ